MLWSIVLFTFLLCLRTVVADPTPSSNVYLAPGPAGEIFVLDAVTGLVSSISLPPNGFCDAMAFNPGGTRLYCTILAPVLGALVPEILAIDPNTNTIVDTIQTSASAPLTSMAITPNGGTAWVAESHNGTVFAIDLVSKQPIGGSFTVGISPSAVAISNDGSQVYIADQQGATVYVIDAVTHAVVTAIPVTSFPQALHFSPDGTELWVAGAQVAQVLDPISKTLSATIPLPGVLGGLSGLAFHPSSRWVYLAPGGTVGPHAGTVVVDRSAKRVVKVLQTGHQTMDVAVTADGTFGFTANFDDGSTTVLNTNGNSVNDTIALGGALLHAVAWQPAVPAILPSACVTHNNDGTYTAKFSYTNSSDQTLLVPVGPGNLFSPGFPDRGQPTSFLSGAQKNAFALTFDGSPATWSVQTPFGLFGAVTVSSASKACQ